MKHFPAILVYMLASVCLVQSAHALSQKDAATLGALSSALVEGVGKAFAPEEENVAETDTSSEETVETADGDQCTRTPQCKAATDTSLALAQRITTVVKNPSIHESGEATYCLNSAASKAMQTCLTEHTASANTLCMQADREGIQSFQATANQALQQARESYGGPGVYTPDCSRY